MLYTINKCKHKASGLHFGVNWNLKHIQRKVMFLPSCKYELHGEDAEDINKLFGVGYLPTHHENSVRFGWRYNVDTNFIEVFSYCYVDGERLIKKLCDCYCGVDYYFNLLIGSRSYFLDVSRTSTPNTEIGQTIVHKHHNKKLGYNLYPYFGGNQTAPRTIHIQINKV